ncbi:MAG: right-handed parallel beta-helix repeat-containing protein [Chloroflexota bacterium]
MNRKLLAILLALVWLGNLSALPGPATQPVTARAALLPAAGFQPKAYTDYAKIVYIDPGSATPGDGSSPEHPLRSWAEAAIAADTAYVQKRGTVAAIGREIRLNQAGVLVGAYGPESDPRPIISDISGGSITHLINVQADGVTVRDLEITSPEATSGIHFAAGAWPSDGVAWNNYVHGLDREHYLMWGIRVFGERTKVLYNRVEYTGDDGMFLQYFDDIEVGYNQIAHVNQKWFEDPSEQHAGGDGIQFDTSDRFSIHHNVIDRSDTGNKFCIIVDPKDASGTTSGGLIENNVCLLHEGMAGIFAGGASVYAITIRNNLFTYAPGDHQAIGVYCHARYPTVYNNVFIGMGQAINLWNDNAEAEVHHNTFYDLGSYAIRGNVGTITATNNLFAIPVAAKAFGIDGLTASHNLFLHQDQATGSNPVIGDPRFVDAGGGDLHLLAGSAAQDAGAAVSGITTDADGERRDAAPDIGAYELQPALRLHGTPGDRAITLAWEVNTSLPATSTWTISYDGPTGDDPSPVGGIDAAARTYTLTGLANYTWYTITLSSEPALLSDTIRVMPSDRTIYLPLVRR